MLPIDSLSQTQRYYLNCLLTVTSLIGCALLLPTRLPGTVLLGLGVNWLLIWVVSWSIKRQPWQGAIAGIAAGLIQDGMTLSSPSHLFSLALVGFLTGRIDKEKYIQEDFVSISLIVFAMAVVAETFTAAQYTLFDFSRLVSIWTQHQQIAIVSALLSSLWAPVVYYPLNYCWQRLEED
ncbi:rod shape-determining protein MreD [Halothece sp. PCC 7418]|uniref:rod shape-determining protein MreD n=1 Tax=Halothece sp. (strain PCC 7418) TaxID=65093 RepID=UPI0002A081C0|nr:rod shape-determining protein MreD [Halothece sp. PCC 7418]AFZ45251.1 rod shape-determining protein MreD [Halothece sp. PCC 7418]